MSKKSFISGAIILMAAGLVVRMLGFVYRIYLSNLIGAEGMGIFQLISPVYSLVILTLTAGISIAVSKMVSSELAQHHYVNLRRIAYCALLVVGAAGLATAALIYFNLDFLVNHVIKDSRTYYSFLLLIPCIPAIAGASALKGYFYGVQKVTPTAISQIVEQIVKIGFVMYMAGYFVNTSLEYACAIATVGMALGEISNLAVLMIIYYAGKKRDPGKKSRAGLLRKRKIISELVKTSIPVSANRFVISIMSAVENILIPAMLVAGGLDYKSSIEEYGRLSGMAMPLIYFPALVTSSLATTLVPAISEAISLKNYKSVNYRITKSIQITFTLGFLFTAIFLSYPNEIGSLIYRRENIGSLLYTLSFACVLIYLQQTLTGVLNGLGKQGILLRNTIIGSTIRIGFVYFLIPLYGIHSYIWGIAVSFLITDILNLYAISRLTGLLLNLRQWLVGPFVVGVFMVIADRYIMNFFELFIKSKAYTTILSLTCSFTVGMLLMLAAGAASLKDFKIKHR